MKHIMIYILLGFILLACNDDKITEPVIPAKVFQVHLQSGFSKTPVEVYIDQSKIFSCTVSTSLIVAYAEIIPVKLNRGTHTLKVSIPNSVTRDTMFNINDSLFIGVNYSALEARLRFNFQTKPYYYR